MPAGRGSSNSSHRRDKKVLIFPIREGEFFHSEINWRWRRRTMDDFWVQVLTCLMWFAKSCFARLSKLNLTWTRNILSY